MKYYFGQVDSDDVDNYGDEGLFEYAGDQYYNSIEFTGEDDFVITDSVGRSIPMSINHVGLLIEVLQNMQETMETIENGKAAEEYVQMEDEIRTFEW
jgi:hypothetical protein